LSCASRAAAAENFAARLAAIWIVSPVGVAPLARRAVADGELAEAGDRDIAARGELARDRVKRGVNGG